MKSARTTLGINRLVLALLVALLCGFSRAQAQSPPDNTNMVLVTDMPTNGTFWSMQLTNFPPFPCDPYPDLLLYTDGTPGNYYYDDLDVDYSAMRDRSRRSGGLTADDSPPSPGGGGGGGGGGGSPYSPFIPPGPGYTNCETWSNFWIQISASSNVITIMISNTLPGMSYNLLGSTNLASPWSAIITDWAATNTFLTTNIDAGTNPTLFFVATLTTNDQPPVITIPPANQVVFQGSNAVFSVTATGLAPLSYQWQFNGTNLSGATNDTLTISDVQTNYAGAYTVIVSNVICEASATAGLGIAWIKHLNGGIDASPAISAEGTIFIATTNSLLYALDRFGNIKWTNSIATGRDGDITSSAAVAANGSAVYIGTQMNGDDSGYLDAFNPTNGELLWHQPLGGNGNSSPAVSASDGTIYVGVSGYYSGLLAIYPSGDFNWLFYTEDVNYTGTYDMGVPVDSSPAVGPDCSVYFLAENDLYAVNSAGSLLWFFPLPANSTPDASPALDGAGNIIVGSQDGYVYSINPSGGLNWIFDTLSNSYPIQASVAVGADGTVYAASTDGVLYAITNGVLKWEFIATNLYGGPITFKSSPAVSADNVIYIGGEDTDNVDNLVYAITNGGVKWTFTTSNYIVSSPAINPADGAVIIASEDGNVYKLPGSEAVAANAPWPMFHQNPGRSGAVPNLTSPAASTNTAFPNNPSISSSQFSFTLSGTFESVWTIYASSDLENWAPIGNATLDNFVGTTNFGDGFVSGLTNRFYEARSGSSCSPVIGFSYITLSPGTNLVANPFYQVNYNDSPQNSALGLLEFLENNGFLYPYLPNGVEILKWNGQGFTVNTYDAPDRQWVTNGDITLLPGDSEFIITTNSVTVPFVGVVSQGVWTTTIVPGTNFISSILPLSGHIQSDLGYQPNNGDEVTVWNGGSPSTYSYSGGWYPSEPFLGVGQGFLLVASNNNTWTQTNLPCSGTYYSLPSVWSTNLAALDPGGSGVDASPAIGTNGTIYIPDKGTNLYAIDPTNGNIVWVNTNLYNSGAEISSSVAIGSNGTLYLGDEAGDFFSINPANGDTNWVTNVVGEGIYATPTIGTNGIIYVGDDDGDNGFWSINPDGTTNWNYALGGEVDSSSAIGADSTSYFLSEANGSVPLDFFALSANGSATWLYPIETDGDKPVDSSPAIDSDGTIYATGYGRYLQAINPDGSPKWAFDSQSVDGESQDFVSLSSPIIGADHTVFAASHRRLFAVTNGVLKWAFPDPSSSTTISFESTPVIDAAGNVYLGDTSGNFYAISSNGLLEGIFPVSSASIISSAVIGTNDVIYFASTDGVLHALGIPCGPATNAPWPMFHKNPQHTGCQPLGPTLAHACGAPFPYVTYGDGLDGLGDFTFSYVGAPGTIWALYESTNFTSWSTDGTTITNNTGVGPQSGSLEVTNINPSNEFFFLTSNGCCSKAIGFIQVTLQPGTNLIADPLYQIDSSIVETMAPNTLQTLFVPYTGAFDGVEVDEWSGQGFDAYTNDGTYWYLNGNVNGDGPLRPGQSALIINSNTNAITVPFIGLVRDGVDVGGTNYVTNYITAGTNYLGSMLPLAGYLSTDLKFPASHGDTVALLSNGTNIEDYTYTNSCGGTNYGTNWVWCPSEPVLGLGQGFVLITTNINNAWVQSVSPCYTNE